jgi:hypothetical protein
MELRAVCRGVTRRKQCCCKEWTTVLRERGKNFLAGSGRSRWGSAWHPTRPSGTMWGAYCGNRESFFLVVQVFARAGKGGANRVMFSCQSVHVSSVACGGLGFLLRMAILPMGTGTCGYLTRMGRVWAHNYIHGWYPYHTLPIKSWVGHGYSLLPVGIPIP